MTDGDDLGDDWHMEDLIDTRDAIPDLDEDLDAREAYAMDAEGYMVPVTDRHGNEPFADIRDEDMDDCEELGDAALPANYLDDEELTYAPDWWAWAGGHFHELDDGDLHEHDHEGGNLPHCHPRNFPWEDIRADTRTGG